MTLIVFNGSLTYAVRENSNGTANVYAGGLVGQGTLNINYSYATGNVSAYATNVSTTNTNTGGRNSLKLILVELLVQ